MFFDKNILIFDFPCGMIKTTRRQEECFCMWTKDYSIRLSVFFTRLFLVLLAAGLFLAPQVVGWFIQSTGGRPVFTGRICAAFYCCAGPAAVLLWSLDRLLAALSRGEVFTAGNIALLRRCSWCCMVVAAVCLGFTVALFYFLLVAAAAAFIGLILRVVKNVFQQAMALKEENDYTI